MAAAKYAHDDAGEAERPMRVCAEAGRKCVRNIQLYPVLSIEWIALVDSLKQLTRLVQLEGRMPANTKVSEAAGRNTDSEGTLWDQEAHENAIRILVEEAKVNLCLRMMNDYKRWSYQTPEAKKPALDKAIETWGSNCDHQIEEKMKQFEESLGILLWRAFVHVETLQLMDIPLLIDHCAMVFENSRDIEGSLNTKLQPTLVLYYFASLMKHAENLNNSELLGKAREVGLMRLATDHFLHYQDQFSKDDEVITVVAEAFAAMADNEDYRTSWEDFFRDEDEKRRFLELEDKLVAVYLKDVPDGKKTIRPLLDLLKTIRRTIR